MRTWDGFYHDLYVVDILSGRRILVTKKQYSSAYLSPDGLKVAYFEDNIWKVFDILTESVKDIGTKLKIAWQNELNDRPRPSNPYGFGGWLESSKGFLIYDKHDIWSVDAETDAMFCLTQGYGRQNKSIFRIKRFASDDDYLNVQKSLFFEEFSIEEKTQKLVKFGADMTIKTLFKDSLKYDFLLKPKNSNKMIISKQSYRDFPDFFVTDTNLSYENRISEVHPEIKDYNWGTTHMVKYSDPKGEELQGYYILPENYEPGKKYPLFVYFYERFSDRRHSFITPRVNHRPIYPWYVSQGYIMFFPDIKFYEGSPGKSGMDAVIAGCDKLIEMGMVDKEKIALHGHSWSGYQSAFFVTQTDYFAACVSGAPVSNMTSAYSGIRLGSGLARQFQYEMTQSRIGGNLIDSLDAYIKNSPVFYADQMNTPLLIMFGDIDEAVPWEQGIELYLACRRFEKPCIFLQYEGEPHHLRKYHNKLDYTIKMKEFFDHFVLGKESKEWIDKGVPFRGKYNTGVKLEEAVKEEEKVEE